MVTIQLRPVQDNDVTTIMKWWNDPEIMKWVGFTTGIHATSEKVLNALDYYREPDRDFIIITKNNGEAIGEFCYERDTADTFHFDIKIGEVSEQRHGYATQAITAGLKVIQDEYAPQKVQLAVSADNFPALALYQKLGFTQVKTYKDNWQNDLGEKMSMVILEKRLADEN